MRWWRPPIGLTSLLLRIREYAHRAVRDPSAAPLSCPERSEGRIRPGPGSRHKRASGACSLRASALVEAVVRAGRRCPSQGGDDRRRPPNRALLLSPTSARQRARRRTIGFVLPATGDRRPAAGECLGDISIAAGAGSQASKRSRSPVDADGLCVGRSRILHAVAAPRFRRTPGRDRTRGRVLPLCLGWAPRPAAVLLLLSDRSSEIVAWAAAALVRARSGAPASAGFGELGRGALGGVLASRTKQGARRWR